MIWPRGEFPDGNYVYELIDPRSGLPFYVGKGSRRRAWAHLYESRRKTKKSAKLDLIRDLTLKDALDLEKLLIESYGRKYYDDGILTNVIKDHAGIDFSKIVYRKGPDHHNYGKTRSSLTRQKQIETCKAKVVLGKTHCRCGCGDKLEPWQRYASPSSRGSHGYAKSHLEGLHNYRRQEIIQELNRKISL